MAKDLAYDDSGDLVLPPTYVYDTEEIAQTLLNIVTTSLGTSIDENVGINFDWLLGGFDKGTAIVRVKAALNQDERVTNVDSVDVAINKSDPEQVDISFKVQTTLGEIALRKGVNVDALNG